MRAAVFPVGRLFAGEFRFHLPWFQRLYAWTEEHVERLVIDIEDAMQLRGKRPGYYLGSLIVAQRDDSIDAAIADGHQRLLTLTILLAVLRDLAEGADRDDLNGRIWRRNAAGALDGLHLIAQPSIANFLQQHVQAPGATLAPFDQGPFESLNAGERNIILNRDWLVDRLSKVSASGRRRLADFLLNQCFVTICAVEDEEDARIIFTVSQTRGHRLSSTDLFKAEVLGVLSAPARRDCSRLWETCQTSLGTEGFQELLGHLRSLQTRRLRHDMLEADLWRGYRLDREAERFVRQELPERTDLFKRINEASFSARADFAPVNRRLQYLGWVTHRGWVPPAMHWLSRHGDDLAATYDFLVRLDRLAYFHMIVGSDGDDRDRRYLRMIPEIDRGRVLDAKSSLAISDAEARQMREVLSGPRLVRRRYKVNLMLRINAALEGDDAPRTTPIGTLEHVLPQGPAKRSDWHTVVPSPADQARLRHTLGNLTILLESENAAADNRDYDVKRPILEGSPFLISRLAAAAPVWNAEVICRRTGLLIEALFRSLAVTD